MKFHLDESVTVEIATALRARGIDCSTTVGAGLRGVPDEVQFAFAVEQSRVLVTADDDFLRIAADQQKHPGLIYWRRERHFGQLVVDIAEFAAAGTSEDFADRVIHLA